MQDDQAEDALLRVLEERHQAREDHPIFAEQRRPTLKDIGLRVRTMNKATNWSRTGKQNMIDMVADAVKDSSRAREPRVIQQEQAFFEGVGGGETPEIGVSHVAAVDTDADRLISGAFVVDKLMKDNDDDQSTMSDFSMDSVQDETLPLTNAGRERRKQQKRKKRFTRRFKRMFRSNVWWALRPITIRRGIYSFLSGTFSFGILPLLGIAAILFYPLQNATPHFLENSSFSYWLVFAARQLCTLSLARVTEYMLVDVLALNCSTVVKLLGPFMTLFAIQAKGWPLQAVLWAFWDLFILFGDNSFYQNWFFFTGLELFSKANPGGDFLTTLFYFRVLLAVLVAGLATAVKRTVMAMSFGKSTLQRYKTRLEKLLVDVLLVSEVAELSKEIEGMEDDLEEENEKKLVGRGHLSKTQWHSMKFSAKSNASGNDDDEDSNSDSDDDDTESFNASEDDQGIDRRKFMSSRSSCESRTIGIKYMLDGWKEPVNKLDRTVDPSIHDILQFRKAISFVDGRLPFSRSFGHAGTRDECIKSAEQTFERLMLQCPTKTKLSFNVLSVLATDEDGLPDQKKMNQLRRVFRPDRYNELSLLAFVQSYDTVYRKLRYFRASVGNNSVIDKVLGEGLDKIFYFLLLLIICVVMDYNPWTLLVSMSTLIVSFAFAVGPSASKYIEGMLLIAARRPYDLGDRILIVSPENVENHGVAYSWLVEDINLFSTTLRFGNTGEVATVNNGSIAGSRIVNCARSQNALITFTFKLRLFSAENKVTLLSDAIKTYVKDRPRTWVQVVFFRPDDIDPDNAIIIYNLRIQHRKTWQDAPAILKDRGELLQFFFKTGEKLGILYDSPMQRIRLYRPAEKYLPHEEHLQEDRSTDDLPEEKSMADALAAAGLETSVDL